MLCCGEATTMLDLNRAGLEQYNATLQSSAEYHVCSTASSSSSFIPRLPRQRSCEGLKTQRLSFVVASVQHRAEYAPEHSDTRTSPNDQPGQTAPVARPGECRCRCSRRLAINTLQGRLRVYWQDAFTGEGATSQSRIHMQSAHRRCWYMGNFAGDSSCRRAASVRWSLTRPVGGFVVE